MSSTSAPSTDGQREELLGQVEQIAPVPVGHGEERHTRASGSSGSALPASASARSRRMRSAAAIEALQHEDLAARQERRVQLERGVLGGRTHQDHGAVLHIGQEAVLLGPVEAVDLVDEEERAAAGQAPLLGPLEDLAQVGDPREHGREGLEGELRHLREKRAMVVLPLPGGPQRIIEARRPAATMRPMGASAWSR